MLFDPASGGGRTPDLKKPEFAVLWCSWRERAIIAKSLSQNGWIGFPTILLDSNLKGADGLFSDALHVSPVMNFSVTESALS